MCCLIFNRFWKTCFQVCFGSSYNVVFAICIFGEKQYGSCLCDMQISYEIISNAHVRQLTLSLQNLAHWIMQFKSFDWLSHHGIWVITPYCTNSEVICLHTLFIFCFNVENARQKNSLFVSANSSLVAILITIDDVTDFFAIWMHD